MIIDNGQRANMDWTSVHSAPVTFTSKHNKIEVCFKPTAGEPSRGKRFDIGDQRFESVSVQRGQQGQFIVIAKRV